MERMADTPNAMRARMCAHLGTPDQATYADWERIYSTVKVRYGTDTDHYFSHQDCDYAAHGDRVPQRDGRK
jgi:hypothetical protein